VERILNAVIEKTGAGLIDSCRVFHGRGGCYPGLEFVTVDFIFPVIYVALYKDPGEGVLTTLRDRLKAVSRHRGLAVVIQRRFDPGFPVEVAQGEIPENLTAREAGLRYRVNMRCNQNLGFFFDMKNVRTWLRAHSRGASVLNLFSYTCAFSVTALAAGATRVVNIDKAKGALRTGRDNHRINGLPVEHVSFLAHDIFSSWAKLNKLGPYDVVVLDPPAFQKGSFDVKKDYGRVIRRLDGLVADGGYVIACLNSPRQGFDFLRDHFAMLAPGFTERFVIAAPEPYKDVDMDSGLKVVVYQRE